MSKKQNTEQDPYNNDFYGKTSTGYPPPPEGFIEGKNKQRLFDDR